MAGEVLMRKGRHKLTLLKSVDGTEYDGHGVPVAQPDEEIEIRAYSIAHTRSIETGLMVSDALTVALGDDYGITASDRILWNGQEWYVDGDLIDCNNGPSRWKPGYIMNLRRGTGV